MAEIQKEDLHPTSDEFLQQFGSNIDEDFLQTFHSIYYDIAALKQKAYNDHIDIQKTMLCLFRISELEEMNLNTLDTRVPIILYLQEKQEWDAAYKHSLHALQNVHISSESDLASTENQTRILMLYECHIENLFYLELYDETMETIKTFQSEFETSILCSSRIFHISFFVNIKLKQWENAKSDISKCIAMNPVNATHYNHRCYVYCELKQYDKALEDAHKCLAIDGNHQIGLNNRGSVYNDLKQYELAIVDLTKSIKLSKGTNANGFKHRAYSHYMLKHYDDAIRDINQALILNEEYEDAKKLKAQIWNDHLKCIQSGIDMFCVKNEMLFLIPLVHAITDFVVGTRVEAKE